MDNIIEHARELGKKIATHPRTVQFMNAARAVAEDKEAQATLKSYEEQVRKIRDLESANKPIEVPDKHKLADCESAVAGNDKLKLMMKFQADYLQMMSHVNNAIDEAIQENDRK